MKCSINVLKQCQYRFFGLRSPISISTRSTSPLQLVPRRKYATSKITPPPDFSLNKTSYLVKVCILLGISVGSGVGAAYLVPPWTILDLLGEDVPEWEEPLDEVYLSRIRDKMEQSPIVEKLNNDSNYKRSIGWVEMPQHYQSQSLTRNTIAKPGGLPVPEINFIDVDNKRTVSCIYIGPRLCGWPGLVHGGMLAILADEALAKTAFMSFPGGLGVTAQLNINYKRPAWANDVIAIKSQTVQSSDNKAVVHGSIYNSKGVELVQVDAIYVVPKQYQLNNK